LVALLTSIPLYEEETTTAFIRTGLNTGFCFQLRPSVKPTKHPMANPRDRCPKAAFNDDGTLSLMASGSVGAEN